MTNQNYFKNTVIAAAVAAMLAGGCASIDSKVENTPKGVHAGTYKTNTGTRLEFYLGGPNPGLTIVETPPPNQQKYKR